MCERGRDGELAVYRLTMFKLSAFLVTALLCVFWPEVSLAAPTNVAVSSDTSTYKSATHVDVSSTTSDVNGVGKVDGALDLTSTADFSSKISTTAATTQRNTEPKTDISTTVKYFTTSTGAPIKTADLKAITDKSSHLSTTTTTTKDVPPISYSTTASSISTSQQTTTSSNSVPLERARAEFLSANDDNSDVSTKLSSAEFSTYKTTTPLLRTLKSTTSNKPRLTTSHDLASSKTTANSQTQTTSDSINGITLDKREANGTTDSQKLNPKSNSIVGPNVTSSVFVPTDKSATSTISVVTSDRAIVSATNSLLTSTDKFNQSGAIEDLTTQTSTEKSTKSNVTSSSDMFNESSKQTTPPAAAASNQVTQYGQPVTDTVTDSSTFEVVDPNNVVSTSSNTVLSTTLSAPAVSDTNLDTNKYPDITDIDSSSGDEGSTVMMASSSVGNNTSAQTSAINTTTDIKTVPILISHDSTVSLSSTSSITTTRVTISDTTTSSGEQTSFMPTNYPTTASSGDGGTTAAKGDNMKMAASPKPLTMILIAVSASFVALIIVLCVVTYVKFRKKSRSIRKRLTFKDDAIYDNPIYHGRWEVPKAPEPTSSSCPRSLPMLISALPDEVLRLSKDEGTGFHLQFMMLNKLSPTLPQQAATSDVNITKNRYRDILPFDHNRVKLDVEEGLPDYINASYVPGVKSEREYIVSQGPLERTAPDHWRMIWELNIRVVTMLTTCEEGDLIFKSKCCQYWPNKENESVNYSGIYVTLVSTARLCRDNYKLKVLHIRKGKDAEPRKVQLFQYIKWPDRKNPDDPEAFLEFRDHVRQEIATTDDQIPVLVHCSAGVGRTGTFIAIDTLLQHMEERESIDVYGLVLRLRRYRVLLVQNVNQYKFVHSSLLIILDKLKKAEVDEGRKKGFDDGTYPYENMVMGQRAVVGELGGLVHGGEESDVPLQQSSAVQNFLRKTKTNAHHPDVEVEDDQIRISQGMPSPVRVDEWPRPLSDPVPRPVIETPKSKPFQSSTKGDPERALAKELGGMFQGGFDHNASPGKTAAIKAFLRNRDVEPDTGDTRTSDIHSGDSLVIDNRFREDSGKQTTCL